MLQHSDLSDDARSGVLSRFSRSLETALHPAVQETEEIQEPHDARSGNSTFDQVLLISFYLPYSRLRDRQKPLQAYMELIRKLSSVLLGVM